MNINRIAQIKESLAGLGTIPEQGYTHREIIDRLINLENALLAGVYEKNHAENMRPQDLTKHFSALAEEFGLADSDTYKRFIANMDELDHAVKSFIAGQKGEQLAKSSLRPLAYDPNVKILYNIALENEEMKTEYDAIVFAPYGLFVVEVKNWCGDVTLTEGGFLTRDDSAVSTNLAARMLVKETLLRDCLGELFPANFHSILLFPENKTRFHDEYHKMQVGFGASVSNSIRDFSGTYLKLAPEQIREMIGKVASADIAQLTYCPVKCDEIIEDYAVLMAQMESASSIEDDSREFTASATFKVSTDDNRFTELGKDILAKVDWKQAKRVAGIALVFGAGVVMSQLFVKRSR